MTLCHSSESLFLVKFLIREELTVPYVFITIIKRAHLKKVSVQISDYLHIFFDEKDGLAFGYSTTTKVNNQKSIRQWLENEEIVPSTQYRFRKSCFTLETLIVLVTDVLADFSLMSF